MSADLARVTVPGTDRQIVATVIDGKPMVSARHACEALGIAVQSQLTKLRSKKWACVTLIVTQDASGRDQQLAMVDRRTFTMWLATIDANRVAEAARPILEAFQAEAADALDAYFNEGGAINPLATEVQLDKIAQDAQNQAAVLKALKGVVDPRFLEAKGRIILARVMGEAPELDESIRPLYVWDYLKEKGLRTSMIDAKAPGFGQRVKKLYIDTHDREPDRHYGEVKGRTRTINAYTEADRPLFDKVWAKDYALKVAESAFTVIDGGAS